MKARDVISFSCHYRRPRIRCKAVGKTLVANGISAGPVVASDGSVVIRRGDLVGRAVSGAESQALLVA